VSRGFTPRALSRREFTVESVLAMLAGVTITITGCGGGSSPTSPSTSTGGGGGTTTQSGDVSGSISANHGHTAVVTAAQITAANGVSLDIRGNADHTHTVTLSADQIRSIGAKQRVSVESTNNVGHEHTVTFN
jgi:hypothetical protein